MAGPNIRFAAPDGTSIDGADYSDDFDTAEKAGAFRIGRRAFYYREGLRRRCLPYAALDSVILRTEPLNAHCCCSVGLAVYRLLLRGGGRELADIQLEDKEQAAFLRDRLNAALAAARGGTPTV